MREVIEALLSSTLEYAPALIFGALSAVLSERAGVVNVGVEGMMRAGALIAALCALTLPTPVAIVIGMLAGAAVAAVHALLCLKLKADQVVSGMALNLVALAGGTYILESLYAPSGTPPIHQLDRWSIPLIENLPILKAFSGHAGLAYASLAFPFLLEWLLRHTPWGLRVRAVGEKPAAATAMGVRVGIVRLTCVLAAGLFAGLGGAFLSTSTLDRFEQHMPAGLGFMAVAAMVFGRWKPIGALGAALFFSAGNALRIGLASSWPELLNHVPQGVLLALPYALTLLLLTIRGGTSQAPAALGIPHDAESR